MASKKKKRQKQIAKIISDGRVTKKEARKAQNQGISLARIQKAQTKSFKPGNVFSKPATSPKPPIAREVARGTYKAPAKPTYSPLVIQGAAQKVFDQGRASAAPAAPAATPNPLISPARGDHETIYTEAPGISPEMQALMDQIADLQANQPEPFDMEGFMAMNDQRFYDLQEENRLAQAALAQQFQAAQAQQAPAMAEMERKRLEMMREQEIAFKTSAENMARGSLAPDFRIGTDPRRSVFGTGGFKRRRPIRPMTIAQGISPTAPTAGATNGNLLNV